MMMMSEWTCERVSEQMTDWLSESVDRVSKWLSEYLGPSSSFVKKNMYICIFTIITF